MGIFEDEHLLVPAAGMDPRALVLHGKKIWKQRNEALALAHAPVAPDAYLQGICGVVYYLGGPGINDDTDGDVSLSELLPEGIHLRLLLGDAALHSERRIADRVWGCFVNLPIAPRRLFHVKNVTKPRPREAVIAVSDKRPLEELEDVVGKQEAVGNTEAPTRVGGHVPAFPLRPGHGAG